MELITGRTGVQHVKATDDAEIYRTLLGDGDFVLSTGAKLNAQMSGTSQVNIQNGTAIMQGRQCKIRQSEGYNAVSIDNGVSGYKRWDIICIEYTIEDGIESADLIVVKGANSTAWVEPTVQYENGSIDAGETHRMKLWGVKLDGINFDSLVDYRTILDTSPVNTLLDRMSAIESQIEARIASLEIMGKSVPQFVADSIYGYSAHTGEHILYMDVPTGYTYDESDVIDIYTNGLAVKPSKIDSFTVATYSPDPTAPVLDTPKLIITLMGNEFNVNTTYSEVIVKIWKVVE